MHHQVVSREEWLAARLGLLKEEKELTRCGDELARRRQELPWVRIDKQYRFETDEGAASLADLFRGRLATPHLPLHVWARLHGGVPILLDNRGRVQWHCRAPGQPRRLCFFGGVARCLSRSCRLYKRRMGWSFPWASSRHSDFNFDFDVSLTEEQQREGPSNITTGAAAL